MTFVVPAHDEEQLLGRTLSAIADAVRQLREPSDVVVVDDASTDRTAEIARAHQAHVVAIQSRQIAAARNAGVTVARGDMLVFVDADTVVNVDVVRAAIAAMRAGAVGGGCGIRFDGQIPLYARALIAALLPLYRVAGLAAGCFLYCTRQAFDAVGGFDETLFAAEEAAMSRALGRVGRFIILRQCVITSGRKLRTHRPREILGCLLYLAVKGRRAVQRRDGLHLWYGARRREREPLDTRGTGE